MNDDRAVPKKAARARCSGGVKVEEARLEGTGGDIAELPCEVADLALFRLRRVARRGFTADSGVEVGKGTGAVAVGGDGLVVDVVN